MEPLEKPIQQNEKAYIFLVAIFVGVLVIAGVLASKIVHVAGLVVPAGALAYSITFPITDIICEVWGKKRANLVVFSGFITLLVILGLIRLALVWPRSSFWTDQEVFAKILGSTSRILIASFIPYLASQYHDVWAFHLLLDTPFVYFGVWLIRKGERNEDRYSGSSAAGNLR